MSKLKTQGYLNFNDIARLGQKTVICIGGKSAADKSGY